MPQMQVDIADDISVDVSPWFDEAGTPYVSMSVLNTRGKEVARLFMRDQRAVEFCSLVLSQVVLAQQDAAQSASAA